MNRRRLPFAIIAVVLLGLIGAGAVMLASRPAAPVGPLAGADIGGPFAAVDQDGQAVTEASFAGRWRLMYFGYTYCPDICPVDMQQIAQGLTAFAKTDAARAAKVVGVFVSVDPARDTPPIVKTFVRAFSPTLVGLTGSEPQMADLRKTYRVYASKQGQGRDYLVDHSAVLYLMDPDGKPVSFLNRGTAPAAIAAELDKYVR